MNGPVNLWTSLPGSASLTRSSFAESDSLKRYLFAARSPSITTVFQRSRRMETLGAYTHVRLGFTPGATHGNRSDIAGYSSHEPSAAGVKGDAQASLASRHPWPSRVMAVSAAYLSARRPWTDVYWMVAGVVRSVFGLRTN